MRSIAVTKAEWEAQRDAAAEGGVHFCESLVEALVREFSRRGEVVLDPFAGFGTTLVVAERLGRRAVGIELLASRAEQVKAKVGSSVVIVGDAREALHQVRREVALCVTSPPYMTRAHHPQNPLTGYRTLDGDYATYLAELGAVFQGVAALLRPGGHLVVDVADPLGPGTRTPLVDDVRSAAAAHLAWQEDIEVAWDVPPAGLAGDTCLVFRKNAP